MLRSWAKQESQVTRQLGATPRWLSSGNSKTRNPGRLRQKEYSKVECERSSHKKKKFVVLIKETISIDKIINFFMNSYWSKIGIFVKLMRKVSMKWKNWRIFRVLPSTPLSRRRLVEDQDTVLELTGKIQELQNEINFWVVQEILKMLNQYSVDNPTSPVIQCFPTCPRSWYNTKPSSGNVEPQRRAAKYWGHAWYIGKRFANPMASSSAPIPQESNPWISNVSEHTSPHVMSESQTPALDPRCQSGPSARNSFSRP